MRDWLAWAVAGGLVLWLLSDQANANMNTDASNMTTIGPNLDQLAAAMLATIRQFESNGDYYVLYGGGHFSDDTHHPNVHVPINLPGYEGQFSTAAGAYQINYPTYTQFAAQVGVSGFSPATQDALGLAILQDTGAVDALASGDVSHAFQLASKRWASLPGSLARQNAKPMSLALSTFDSYLGVA